MAIKIAKINNDWMGGKICNCYLGARNSVNKRIVQISFLFNKLAGVLDKGPKPTASIMSAKEKQTIEK